MRPRTAQGSGVTALHPGRGWETEGPVQSGIPSGQVGRSQRLLRKERFPAAQRRLWPAVVLHCPLGDGLAGPRRPAGSTGHAALPPPPSGAPAPSALFSEGLPLQTGSRQPAVQTSEMMVRATTASIHPAPPVPQATGPHPPCCCFHSPDEETEAQPGSCHGQVPACVPFRSPRPPAFSRGPPAHPNLGLTSRLCHH